MLADSAPKILKIVFNKKISIFIWLSVNFSRIHGIFKVSSKLSFFTVNNLLSKNIRNFEKFLTSFNDKRKKSNFKKKI